MTYSLITPDGATTAITESAFNALLAVDTHYRYTTDHADCLFPYCPTFTNFRLVTADGKEHCFSRNVFLALVRTQNQHRVACKKHDLPFSPQFYACRQDKQWTLIPPTPDNFTLSTLMRNSDRVESNNKSSVNRCFDYINNTFCRYVRDKDGNRIKNADGKPIPTKCRQCPRTGEAGGERINCCLRHICTAECWRCPVPKQCSAPQVLGGYDVPNLPDFNDTLEEQQFIEEHKSLLTKDELAYYEAVYINGQKPTDYIRTLVSKNPGTTFQSVERRQYRIRNSIKQKAVNLKKEKY